MNEEDRKHELLSQISAQRTQDKYWARYNFRLAQTFVWAAIFASFGSAIASATAKVPGILIAAFAAVPGIVLVIDRSFAFSRRAHWYYLMCAHLQRIENALQYENMTVVDASKEWSSLIIEMEKQFPGLVVDGVTPQNPDNKPSS